MCRIKSQVSELICRELSALSKCAGTSKQAHDGALIGNAPHELLPQWNIRECHRGSDVAPRPPYITMRSCNFENALFVYPLLNMFGALPVADSFFVGLTATVDGGRYQSMRFTGASRGILIETAGRHHVDMRFLPPGSNRGLACTGVGLLFLCIFRLGDRTRRMNRLPSEQYVRSPRLSSVRILVWLYGVKAHNGSSSKILDVQAAHKCRN